MKSTEQMLDELFESLDEDEDMRKQAKKKVAPKRIIAKRVLVQGPPGPQGAQGPQGPTGKAEQSHVTDALNYLTGGSGQAANPVWLSEATEPGLYVIKNSGGLTVIRITLHNNGLKITKSARYEQAALQEVSVHLDILRNSTFQKIKE